MLEQVATFTLMADGWLNGHDKDGNYVVTLSPDDALDLLAKGVNERLART